MLVDITDRMRRMMGWCPQKGFNLADARREKHEQYDDEFHEMNSHVTKGITTGEKLIIYYQNVNIVSIAIILFSIVIAISVLMIIALFVPIFRNFVFIIFSIASFIISFYMFYFNGKNAELTAGSIIVNRPFHKSVVIPKDSILKTEVVKNYSYSLRRILPPIVIIMLTFSMSKIIDVSSQYFTGNYSLLDATSNLFVYIGLMLIYISIYFMGKKKSTYRNALKITAKLKNEVSLNVYVDDPQEMKNKLEVNL